MSKSAAYVYITVVILAAAVSATLSGTQEAKASITGDFGNGYDTGRAQARSDFNSGASWNDNCPNQGGFSYCAGYIAGYDKEWLLLKEAQ